MILTDLFVSDENRMELLPTAPGDLSCLCKFVDLVKYIGKSVPWHWHHHFEINYVVHGESAKIVADKQYNLRQGEAVFVNSNTLHSVPPVPEGEKPLQYYTIFFDADFVTGGYNNVFSRKYMLPITACPELQSFPIRPDSSEGVRMLNILIDIIDLFREEPFGFEFKIRAKLSEFWLYLYHVTEEIRSRVGSANAADETRIKQMMQFVEEHFREKLLLSDIAAAAGISGRECSRCFARTIQLSPVDYLNRYRMRAAAARILETDDPIGRIAEECGFASDSYFGKMFKRIVGCAPREYRGVQKSMTETATQKHFH